MSRPTVAVLMSTYNGEKYLKEQIDSILAQIDVDVTLYIRDDGSADNTENIIREYMQMNNNIVFYKDGKNLRPGASFLKLLCNVVKNRKPYDYYAFADQDDIWLEEKLIAGIDKIKDIDGTALYCSNQIIYRNGKREGMRFEGMQDLSLIGHLTKNDISGCTMVMNHALAEQVVTRRKPSKKFLDLRCHDTWIIMCAIILGYIVYDENSYILYRIHEENVVGVKERTFIQRLQRFTKQTAKNLRSRSAGYLLRAFKDVDMPQKRYVEEMAYYRRSLYDKLRLITDRNICKTRNESGLFFALKVLIGFV